MSRVIEAPTYRSPEWYAWRCRGLGASELPAILGQDPYKGEYEVALVKRGEAEEFGGNAATRWGARIESLALDAYAEMHGVKLTRGETWVDDHHEHLWATLDARHGRVGVEVKAAKGWTIPPANVRIQAFGQIGLADLDAVDVVRVSPFGEPIVTTIERDEGEIAALLDYSEEWWATYGPDGILPDLDGSDAARKHLERLAAAGTLDARDLPEMARLMASLRQTRLDISALEEQDALLRNQLASAMAGYDRAEGTGWRITWSAVKGRTTTDWRSVAAAYRLLLERAFGSDGRSEADALAELGFAVDADVVEALAAIEGIHTNTGDPTRSFRPTWTEEV